MWQINKYKRAYIYIYIYAHKKSPYLSLTNKHVYNGVIAGQSLYKRHQIHFMCMMLGHLRNKNVFIQRQHLRSSLVQIDPVGRCLRWFNTIGRCVYSVGT